MTPCEQSGCRHLEVRCKDCGRSAGKMILPDEKHNWISVSDRLPSDFDNVLIWSNGMCVTGAYLVCVELGKPLQWIVNDWDESETTIKLDDVTHWMPLPEPPKDL
jgi:hypothetical protein